MENRRALLFFVLLFFLLSAPEPGPPTLNLERERHQQKKEEQRALSLLNTSRYGDLDSAAGRWLPLGGLTKDDGYAWGLLPAVKDRARDQLYSILQHSGLLDEQPIEWQARPLRSDLNISDLQIPVYRNVTGKIRGNWVRWHGPETENLPQLNTTAIMLRHDYFTNIFANNITTDHGALLIELQEEDREGLALDGSSAREIRADITLYTDVSLGASHFVRLFGVHFPSSGGIILSTTSEKFAGLSAMPQFALSNDTFELARQLLNRSLTETLAKEKAGPVDYLPWSSLPNGPSTMTFPAPKCEYIVYLQQHPVVIKGQIARIPLLQSIEDELRFPIGAPVPSPPLMAMSMTLFSPDCGFVLESKGSPAYSPLDGLYLSGPKQEQYRKHAGRLVVIMAAVLCTQIHLLMRQMKEASTPSTRSRVSFYTIAMMSIGDALFGSFILMQLYDEAPFLLLTTATFLTFFSVSFLAMKFQIEVWVVQAPERRETDRSSSARATGPSQSLPAPATAHPPLDTGATPIIILRLFPPLLLVMVIILANSPSPNVRPDDILCLPLLLDSADISQCNAKLPQGTDMGIRGGPEPHPTWVWMQTVILAGQDLLGPRFLVPNGWAPPAYDYHPILRDTSASGSSEDIEAAGVLPIGFLRGEAIHTAPSSSGDDNKHGSDNTNTHDKDRKTRRFDCAICMQDIDVPVLTAPSSSTGAPASVAEGAANLLSRRAYMVTPCRHIFHSTCLESWMRLRLQCPICRENLPPI
ncbi:RING finger ubiquitin ligase [Histoplasma capsulatum]|uniref:DSC E3 ubiquitin ligase complex subunit A n=1 Tax=Ajellomyces capsulatus TaxID=5037 RepID=A0A8A1M8Q6_AJECA|nr:RING finger ubiquitin ligase [Histoplasma capsulatum]